MNELYEEVDFGEAWKYCKVPCSFDRTMFLDYHIQEGFLSKNQKLYIPQGSVRLNLIKEIHGGGLGGNFGMDKTTTLVKERCCCPSFNNDVRKFAEFCRVFQLEKDRIQRNTAQVKKT